MGRLQLVCPFRPGMDGCPDANANFRGFCGELDAQLAGLSGTLEQTRRCAAARLDAARERGARDGNVQAAGARDLLHESLATQLQVQSRMLSTWAGEGACGTPGTWTIAAQQ